MNSVSATDRLASEYPPRDEIVAPDPVPGADHEWHLGWQVQHNRVWVALGVSAIVNVLLIVLAITEAVRFRPAIHYRTFDAGYVVDYNVSGNAVIDGVEYVPQRLRAVVTTFIDNRYGYDYQNIEKLHTALNMMAAKPAEDEREKIRELNPQNSISNARLKVQLFPDYSRMDVKALGKGRFDVTVSGFAKVNDVPTYPNPDRPLERRFTVRLVLQTVPASDENPLGYEVVSTQPRDPIL